MYFIILKVYIIVNDQNVHQHPPSPPSKRKKKQCSNLFCAENNFFTVDESATNEKNQKVLINQTWSKFQLYCGVLQEIDFEMQLLISMHFFHLQASN